MKTISHLILLLVIALQSCSEQASTTQAITGHIDNNSEYRGGANPPDFLLAQLAVYHPSANQTFYVRDANNYLPFSTVITTFVTDANGDYTLNLPQGNYAVIGQDKYDFEQNPQATPGCDYLAQPDFTLNVVSGQGVYSSQFTLKRNNCTLALPN